MKLRRHRVRSLVASTVATAGTAAVALFGIGHFSPAGPQPYDLLTSGTDFTITSTITAGNPTCATPTNAPALFYPGVTRCITYKVTNNLPAPITVTTIGIAIDRLATPTPLPGCDPAANLDLSGASFGPPMTGFSVGPSPASASSPSLPIKMIDHGLQNGCFGAVFNFDYTGTATYTQQVSGSCVAETLGATVITTTSNGNYEVHNGQTVYLDGLDGGRIKGNVQVDATGKFIATGGAITGNVISSGGYVSLKGTQVGGNVQTTNAWLALGPGTTVGGNAQVTGGGPVCIDGSSMARVQVSGNLQMQQLTAAHTQNTSVPRVLAATCSTRAVERPPRP